MVHDSTPVPTTYTCLWYKAGDFNRPPYFAIVVGTGTRGALDLTVFGRRMTTGECYEGVRHKDDPIFTSRPQRLKDNGCWDYFPGTAPPVKPAAAPNIKTKDLLYQLADEGKSPPEIAKLMTDATKEAWSHQRVNAILRNRPKE